MKRGSSRYVRPIWPDGPELEDALGIGGAVASSFIFDGGGRRRDRGRLLSSFGRRRRAALRRRRYSLSGVWGGGDARMGLLGGPRGRALAARRGMGAAALMGGRRLLAVLSGGGVPLFMAVAVRVAVSTPLGM